MKINNKKIFQWLGWVLVFVLLGNFYRLSFNPYGWFLWSNLFFAIALAILLLILKSLKCFSLNKKFWGFLILSIGLSILITSITCYIDYRILFFPETRAELSKEQWKQDVLFLKKIMTEKHPNVFALISKDSLDSQFDYMLSHLNNWTDNQIRIELMKTVSLLDDGHSIIPPQPSINFNCLPIIMHKFNDGIYVINTSKEYEGLKDSKILSIGNLPVEEVFKRLKPYIGVENEGGEWDRFPLYGSMTELLHDLGITDSGSSAKIKYSKNNIISEKKVNGQPFYQWFYFYFAPDGLNNRLPYEHRILNNSYWFDYNEASKELYVNVETLKDQSSESIKQFSLRLTNFIENNEINKTILDLRNNRGGDNFKSRVLFNVFKDQKKINQYGKFFTLISRRTFSAATNFTSLLENQTKTIFIGKPTGQGGIHYGDAKGYKLPNSRIHVFLSSLKWQGHLAQDKRKSIEPDYFVKYNFNDYQNNIDPALKLIQNLKINPRNRTLNNKVLDTVLGKYLINNDQVVTISKDSTGYNLFATDFVPKSLRDIKTSLYSTINENEFNSDINKFRLTIENSQPKVIFYNDTIALNPLPKGFKFSIQKIAEGDYVNGIKEFKEHLDFYRNHNLENYFNRLGYNLLRKKDLKTALSIFQINTELYPNSSNAWDSYGEGLLENGKIKAAKKAYEKSVNLDPNNVGAKKMLIRIN